ncbi:MAG TPA: nucleoside triphosphate pyrophosphatase [Candidatus Binataceae bacterium]|nr:nucleoside triphosphate pyrophosphatase [Candidatus Binataceae bacterium]
MKRPHLILASASPRRKTLLEATGLTFTIVSSGADETRQAHEDAITYAVRVACDKALSVSAAHRDALVVAADTIVELEGEILQKPIDAADAARMLRMLSGATHTVVTAFAVASEARIVEKAPIIARVTFHSLSQETIDAYIETGEPFDKAGSYGIQDRGADFIAAVEGSRDTVMGLPVKELMAALERVLGSQVGNVRPK